MSMKRILGTMLATRMAGRGRSRGALGSAAALGLFGARRRKRGGLGGKLGLAALGYMAYQAYKDSQSKRPQTAGHTASSGSGGGLIDKLRDTANDFLAGGASAAGGGAHGYGDVDPQDMSEGEAAAERFSEDEALLMIRAMVTAAYADGALSQDERGRIMRAIEDADATPQDRQIMEREIANPKPLDALLAEVNDAETAGEFYLASRAAIDGDSPADRAYLADLRRRLNLSEEEAIEADEIAS
ncbi:DUF533 domain-containing protein [Tropicimonas sp. IMCC34011]|uniref:DUF533 domain-containing protein n=1 Tax=Tropicimonas sp. IMCC34011 TaxID=2248759 RepID=UPI000E277C43|nr:DUF533 domain-containing protein [Tropicimonas sp. IMCC34011]